ncbi:hypothetical protein [Alteromonas lipolytica]|uniref:hypothetical protein n=1 Tax=Alteromonas lipolytica TaxID=1856405 RepID=UPI001113107F|nr:hypothetical protein [Alteromonas lipolytica]GGF66718.1 hypothetical protein GCM10011338_18620 [Alteromonas lipolytica]
MSNTSIKVRVKALQWECDNVIRITLAPLEGLLPPVEAGAHVDVTIPDAPTRQYSLTAGGTQKSYGGLLAAHSCVMLICCSRAKSERLVIELS